jgi:hypothetical protein
MDVLMTVVGGWWAISVPFAFVVAGMIRSNGDEGHRGVPELVGVPELEGASVPVGGAPPVLSGGPEAPRHG